MSLLSVEHISKSFGNLKALDNVGIQVQKGQFFTLLGPSGCGKTTLLRVIAGFENADRGTIRYRGHRIDRQPPHKREISMVFQDYALFPHLTVYQNIAYGLKTRNKSEIRHRVQVALKTVQMDGLEKRMPDQLSGGQQQRVAVARALATETPLILMDEPLSNLDARLRIEMREQIREIQKSAGIAILYVTHDQEEALAVSDRIVVLNEGTLMQAGTPPRVYADPENLFTAQFVGEMNVFPGMRLAAGDAMARSDLLEIAIATTARQSAARVTLAIRPEEIRILDPQVPPPEAAHNIFEGTLQSVSFTGPRARCFVRLESQQILVDIPGKKAAEMAEDTRIRLHLPPASMHIFRADNGQRMRH